MHLGPDPICRVKRACWQLQIEGAFIASSVPWKARYYCLEKLLCAPPGDEDIGAVLERIRLQPDEAFLFNKNNCLPLHHACRSAGVVRASLAPDHPIQPHSREYQPLLSSSVFFARLSVRYWGSCPAVVEALLNLNPDAVAQPGERWHRLPLHMLVSQTSADGGVVRRLIDLYSEVCAQMFSRVPPRVVCPTIDTVLVIHRHMQPQPAASVCRVHVLVPRGRAGRGLACVTGHTQRREVESSGYVRASLGGV